MKKLLAILVVLGLFLVGAGSMVANEDAQQQFELGLQSYLEDDYEQALRWWRPLAEQGLAWAQMGLGVIYYNGHGVEEDHGQAVYWFRLAAEQGLAEAQNNLGTMYERGYGVEEDYGRAVHWFRQGAEQGLAEARTAWGKCTSVVWG